LLIRGGAHGHRGVKRLRLGGELRSPIDPDPANCRFYGRGPKGQSHCAGAMPQLRPLENGYAVACHYPETGARAETATAA
jgi:hypothetical protein